MRILWVLGACLSISVGLLASYFITKKQEKDYINDPANHQPTVVVPLWLCALPLAFALYTYMSAIDSAENYWRAEELNFSTSDMDKKDFLNYRVLDDRQKSSSALSLSNTGIIGSAALFGPYLRGDAR
jgi:hypothetical protein